MNNSSNCIDIFYNYIVPEAQKGRINSFFTYNIIFNTNIEDKKQYKAITNNDNIFIPTLDIKDKKVFDSLLQKYVDICIEFYDKGNYCEELLNGSLKESVSHECIEKTIMALLFSNATYEDFNNPINFLKKRINFLLNSREIKINYGYIDKLKSNLNIEIVKDIINNETPYKFMIKATSLTNEEYTFPSIKFGVSDNKLYVYAIQKEKEEKNSFSKKINRLLYKVGEGFDSKIDNDDIYDVGNLNDITPSFLISANIFLSYFKSIGINDVIISSILIERWNGKQIAFDYKSKIKKISEEGRTDLDNKQLSIQKNLTDKFIRTFLRLKYNYDGIKIESYPYELDSNLRIKMDNLNECKNSLLNDTNIFKGRK